MLAPSFSVQGHIASRLFGCLLVVFEETNFLDPTWHKENLLLRQHYFTLLKWPQREWDPDPRVSLLEIMLDFCIIFQQRLPINIAENRLRSHGIPVLPPKSPAKYVPLSRTLARTLARDTFKGSTHTFRRVFDSLYSRIHLVPFPRENLRSLANPGFSNVVRSLRAMPRLLPGCESRRLISQTLVLGIRVLKYPYCIPRRPSTPLPPVSPLTSLDPNSATSECLSHGSSGTYSSQRRDFNFELL